jgi:hypothetical protein
MAALTKLDYEAAHSEHRESRRVRFAIVFLAAFLLITIASIPMALIAARIGG